MVYSNKFKTQFSEIIWKIFSISLTLMIKILNLHFHNGGFFRIHMFHSLLDSFIDWHLKSVPSDEKQPLLIVAPDSVEFSLESVEENTFLVKYLISSCRLPTAHPHSVVIRVSKQFCKQLLIKDKSIEINEQAKPIQNWTGKRTTGERTITDN